MIINGTLGETIDVLSGGSPKTTLDILLLFNSIHNMLNPGIGTTNPNNGIMQIDHTRYVTPMLLK